MTECRASLALETSQREQSVVIERADGSQFLETIDAADRTREDLLPAFERAISRAGIQRGDLGALMLNAGPGGFTGLRMAHAAIQAAAIALRVPVVQVPGALCARAAAVLAGDLAAQEPCWVALASKGVETWIAMAEGSGSGRSIEVEAWEPGACRTLIADEHLPASWQRAVAEFGLRTIPLRSDARAVLAAGRAMLDAGRVVPPEALVPTYPREAEAVRLWRERKAARTDGTTT
jgi:tRNA threonylcarbamoyl adenosine modification protein YeaZ